MKYPNTPRPFPITSDIFDRTLIARLSIDPNDPGEEYAEFAAELYTPLFEYLLGCWRRAHEIKRGVSSPVVFQQRIGVLDKAKELLVSYAGLVLQMPDMFPQVELYVSRCGDLIMASQMLS
ncbi:LOW QUALITY PROTEIN: hypothetical protein BC937DRAFT_95103 [Endogone sp. FLAS-F59071]|nr:LOW QUALITY PROTEIN: hypothetical protein BC937DRAFT_95103 [Endogone sp. FLAS-F59071]|eukprot:RUS13574.1 LOW QUALITY PROTEIN: hypothetical protein BC937DRAFT_95103 [Endogone sp. FLAS-F59071]